MHIGFISTRLAGTDGVSLETQKWVTIIQRLEHETSYCAGELDPGLPGMLVPEMHFNHSTVKWIHDQAFGSPRPCHDLLASIDRMAQKLKKAIQRFVEAYHIDILIAENILAIPMNIPLGVALTDFIAETNFPTIAHHHDFYWERERFQKNCIREILEKAFPPTLPSIHHVVINTPAAQSLREQRGLDSTIIPNIFDFSRAARGINTFSRDLRGSLGLTNRNLMILQPTRVIRRKGIELSIELVKRLREPENVTRLLGKEPVLVITHHAGDEGQEYLQELEEKASAARVPMIYAATRFRPIASVVNQKKVYSLWDAYVQADFVTYPSRYEGFGNALLETVYFRLPLLVNRYNVFNSDIAPLGFELVEIDGEICDETIEQVIEATIDPVIRRHMVEFNYQLALEHFSYEAVTPKVQVMIQTLMNGGKSIL